MSESLGYKYFDKCRHVCGCVLWTNYHKLSRYKGCMLTYTLHILCVRVEESCH